MNNPSTSPTSQTAGVRIEPLYGTPQFQVRIRQCAPGHTMPVAPEPNVRKSQHILVVGQLNLDSSPKSSAGALSPQPGQLLQLDRALQHQLHNPGNVPAVLLSVCWGDGLPPIPLHEITETRPWGSFTVLKDEPAYKLKQLMVKPGNRLSLQRHQKREEHWLITQGCPEITLDDQCHCLQAGQYIRIPRQSWHRITNPTPQEAGQPEPVVEIIELQLGEYFGEDDIERREDDYGRA